MDGIGESMRVILLELEESVAPLLRPPLQTFFIGDEDEEVFYCDFGKDADQDMISDGVQVIFSGAAGVRTGLGVHGVCARSPCRRTTKAGLLTSAFPSCAQPAAS